MSGRGVFISIEGGDGSGKSTQIRLLSQWLVEAGRDVLTTREPGGTALGEQVREILLHGGDISPRTEALFYAADRAHHVATKIRPALEKGQVVITDRYLDSSVAYQGAARSLGVAEVRELSLWAAQGLLPDLTIVIDVPGEVAAARAAGRAKLDRIESAGAAFHAAVRQQFRDLVDREPGRCRLVNGMQEPGEVAAEIRALVEPLLASSSEDTLLPSPCQEAQAADFGEHANAAAHCGENVAGCSCNTGSGQ